MKLTELMAECAKLLAFFGDIEVVVSERNINATGLVFAKPAVCDVKVMAHYDNKDIVAPVLTFAEDPDKKILIERNSLKEELIPEHEIVRMYHGEVFPEQEPNPLSHIKPHRDQERFIRMSTNGKRKRF